MIKTKSETQKRHFKGVDFELLSSGAKSMITKMNYKAGQKVEFHRHQNEQAGYVLSGKIRLQFSDYDQFLSSGDSYVIPENVNHSVEVIESGEVLDVFTPPREDYL